MSLIIDAHQHFWQFDPVRDAWIDDSMQRIRRDFLPGDLVHFLQANNVDGCVAVQASQSDEETRFLLKLAAENDFIKVVVGWIDLQADNLAEQLDELKNQPKLVGFRHIVQAEPDDDFVLRSIFQRGIRTLQEVGYTYDLLVFPHQLPAAIKLTDNFPNQAFVLDHIAKPLIKSAKITEWERNIRQLAERPNVYCKISGIVTEADWKYWTYEQLVPYLDVIFDAFGADRVMFGSDWPVCLVAAEYAEVKGIIEKYIANFTAREKSNIFGINARTFYKF